MGRRTVARFANRIKRVLSPRQVNDLGRRIGFRYRGRFVTPYRLVPSLLASHAREPVETLADIHRQFNALFAMTVAYKPAHNQLFKDTVGDLMREVLCGILQHWTVEVTWGKGRRQWKGESWRTGALRRSDIPDHTDHTDPGSVARGGCPPSDHQQSHRSPDVTPR